MRGRVRWGNVGRVAGAAAVMALVVAWPRLGGDAVVVPGGAAVPFVAGSPRPAPTPRVMPTPAGTAQVGEVKEKSAPPRRARRRKHPAGARRGTTPAAPRAPAPVAPPQPAPQPTPPAPPPEPTIDPAEREFGFER